MTSKNESKIMWLSRNNIVLDSFYPEKWELLLFVIIVSSINFRT